MADVQLKNGYFKIANELFEQFFIRDFTLKQLKVLFLLLRCSYGFHKKVAVIKPKRLFELAYVYRCDINEELKFLKQNNVIRYNLEFGEFQLNKNFDEWKIPYHKLFDADDLVKLKKLNLEAKEVAAQFNTPDEVRPENVCETQTEVFANHKQEEAENTNTDDIQGSSKYREIIEKDKNNIYISNNEEVISKPIPKIDPYINPDKKKFTEEYKKIFHNDCYLNNMQHTKLVEIAAEVPNFLELIPVLVLKFSKITFNFDGVKKKPGLRWLLEEGNWAGVLSGEFDAQIEGEQEGRKQNDGYNY